MHAHAQMTESGERADDGGSITSDNQGAIQMTDNVNTCHRLGKDCKYNRQQPYIHHMPAMILAISISSSAHLDLHLISISTHLQLQLISSSSK